MINNHVPVMLNEVKSYIPINKNINLIDATFGGGGYSKAILEEFNVKYLLAIDRDPISKNFFKELNKKYQNIELFNEKFSKIDEVIYNSKSVDKQFDVIIFDLGVSSNQIDNPNRGFSFMNEKGEWAGFEVDYCRGIAAAIFNDPNKVKFIPLTNQMQFLALNMKQVDVLARVISINYTRATQLSGMFPVTHYFDDEAVLIYNLNIIHINIIHINIINYI